MCHSYSVFVCYHALAVLVVFSLDCVHVVWSYAQSQCCVVTLRLFPGLAGFPSPPSFTPRLLIPALCLICIMINSHTLCKA